MCLRLVSANNAKNGVQLLLLAAAIVNNDSFPVFVVYGRVANPCSMYYLWVSRVNNCDLILENPTYRAKLKNGVIHTTRKFERRRVHWYL